MSIIGGLVDTHHEMELTPSAQLVERTWFYRHMWTVLGISAAALGTAAAAVFGYFEP